MGVILGKDPKLPFLRFLSDVTITTCSRQSCDSRECVWSTENSGWQVVRATEVLGYIKEEEAPERTVGARASCLLPPLLSGERCAHSGCACLLC